MATAYPLSWPDHISRSRMREKARFKTTLPAALRNVQSSLKLFARDTGKPLSNLTISSNCTLGIERPHDPGVAVWFTWDGVPVCFPIDRYQKVEDNLQAIHHIIEAERVKLRHGTLAFVRAGLMGFKALPPTQGEHWSEVLAISKAPTKQEVETSYREKARGAHPDTGGSEEAMKRLNAARTAALKSLGE